MNCQLRLDEFRAALQPHQRMSGLPGGTTTPIVIQTEPGNLLLTSTDGQLITLTRAKVEMTTEEGQGVTSLRLLCDFIQITQETTLRLQRQGEDLLLSSGQTTARLRGLSPPEIAQESGAVTARLRLPIPTLRTILQAVLPAAGRDPHRPILEGIYFGGQAELKVVATDGFRLAEVTTELPWSPSPVVIPERAASELSRSLKGESCEFRLSEGGVEVEGQSLRLRTGTIAGNFPEYQQIIPREVGLVCEVDRAALSRAIKLAGLFSPKLGQSVRLTVTQNELVVAGTSELLGEEATKLVANYTGRLEGDLSLVVNAKFLLDGLSPITAPNVALGLISSDQPIVIRSELAESISFLYLVMPLHDQKPAPEMVGTKAEVARG